MRRAASGPGFGGGLRGRKAEDFRCEDAVGEAAFDQDGAAFGEQALRRLLQDAQTVQAQIVSPRTKAVNRARVRSVRTVGAGWGAFGRARSVGRAGSGDVATGPTDRFAQVELDVGVRILEDVGALLALREVAENDAVRDLADQRLNRCDL